MLTAYIALGSNLGNRDALLRVAIEQLARLPHTKVVATSSFRETEPVDAPAGSPPFLNGAVALETELPPDALLAALEQIERTLGRVRGPQRNAPRSIDLDLLLYGDRIIATGPLTVPHPRMANRRFVLEPLAEIAPEAYHPLAGKTVRQLLAELPLEGARGID